MTGPRLLADENIAASLVRALREDGIDVSYVAELASGITDDEVLDLAKAEARLLLTEDKDFGELVFRMKRRPPGVLLLRIPLSQRSQTRGRLQTVLRLHGHKLAEHFTVVEPERVRFRLLPVHETQ